MQVPLSHFAKIFAKFSIHLRYCDIFVSKLAPPPPSMLCTPQLQGTCHYIVNYYFSTCVWGLQKIYAPTKLGGGGGSQTEKVPSFFTSVSAASIMTHLAICYERHRVIMTPLQPRLSKRSIRKIIAGIWAVAIVYSTPYLFVYTTMEYADGLTACLPQ